jgi:hypothetical protein
MRTLAQRQNSSQQPSAFSFARSSAAEPAAFHKADELVENSAPAAVMGFAHDFSRIPVSAKPQATAQPKLTISSPDNAYEQEADRAANRVMRMPEPQLQRADDYGGGGFGSEGQQAPLALPVQNRPMMLMRQPDDKTQAQKQPAPAPPQKQPAPAQQNPCAKLNLSALKLPRKNNNNAEFFEETIKGIRFLAAVAKAQAGAVKGNFKKMVDHIEKLNLLVADPTHQLKLVIVTEGASMFRSLCGQPVLIIDPKDFDAQTVVHETTHGVTAELAQGGQASGAQAAGAKNFLDKAADIFFQLSSLTIEVPAGNPIAATNLVDPSTLNPKATGEHPGKNVDEFLSSAVAAYQLNKKVLEKKIQEFGKKDPKVKQAGGELMDLLSALLDKNTLPAKTPQLASATKDVDAEVKRIQSTPAVDEVTLATHGLLSELLLP